ncbi:hypothetical protein E2C01_095387 [Portunus trituberculatus]|uniref:Uncharacterized protein n=1 Tax=Portunus trituberculatus TaxID=210409 RepID=A0A5B7JSW4_PORTR|nr:hypothetical protein [Portunus trituberculatus]
MSSPDIEIMMLRVGEETRTHLGPQKYVQNVSTATLSVDSSGTPKEEQPQLEEDILVGSCLFTFTSRQGTN